MTTSAINQVFMAKSYVEVNPEIIESLKARGFTSVQMVLVETGNPYRATVEMIPGNYESFQSDVIWLDSKEIEYYLDGNSVMTRYVIDLLESGIKNQESGLPQGVPYC